ncbi:MAG: FadR/GntR family transcriptional regulator, partial [Streptosporangiaceae bacterium]
AVEMEAVALAAQRRGDKDLKAMKDALKDCRTAAAQQDMVRFAEADRRFHTLVVEATANPVLIGLYAELSDVLLTTMRELAPFGELKSQGRLHNLIYDAICEQNAVTARKHLRAHLHETERRLHEALLGSE